MSPRIFCIPALKAPIVAVIRRGPSAWSHLGKWDLDRLAYEPGGWIKANLYPQRCDLSPDGRWFSYFTLKSSAKWKAGTTYVAISRLPWLTALVAWGTCGTWTRGVHFVDDRSVWQVGAPDGGDVAPCRSRFGIAVTEPATFAVERRRGWTESPGSPQRARDDMWDLRRAGELKMEKTRPRSNKAVSLRVHGYFAAFRSGPPARTKDFYYEINENGKLTPLEDVQWADWSADGRLLVATTDGKLQIRDYSGSATWVQGEMDLRSFTPNPAPPPNEASQW
jgi:hypothetical protein